MNKETTNQQGDELDELIVDENQPVNKGLLASIIRPYVESIGKNGVISYSNNLEGAPAWKKILIFLCCKKVMFLKEIEGKESAGPTEISNKANVSLGSAKNVSRDPNLIKLVASAKGEYYIPSYQLNKVAELVK